MHPQTRYLVVKGKAGMGNRLLSLMHAVVYALITRRTMIVDWSDYTYSHSGEDVFDEFFVLQGIPRSREALSGLRYLSISPPEWVGHLELTVTANKKRVRRATRWRKRIPGVKRVPPRQADWNLPDRNPVDVECPADVRVMWSYNQQIKHFSGQRKQALFGTESADEIVQIVLREHLRPASEVQARADDFVGRHQPVIGVHVRHSDLKTNAPLSQCFDRIDALRADGNLFVATDNSDVLAQFERRYGRRVVASEKWYPAPTRAAHQSADCPDRTENGRAALLDMLVLSRCETLLRQEGSTFSLVAGHFSGRPCSAWNVSR